MGLFWEDFARLWALTARPESSAAPPRRKHTCDHPGHRESRSHVRSFRQTSRPRRGYNWLRFDQSAPSRSAAWSGTQCCRECSFLRRSGSLAQSSGRYIRAAIKQFSVVVANEAATMTTAFSILPRFPLYSRLTPTVWLPLLAVPVSTITPMA